MALQDDESESRRVLAVFLCLPCKPEEHRASLSSKIEELELLREIARVQ